MYRLDCKPGNQASVDNETATKLDLWDQRMAHLNVGQMKAMASKELIKGSDIPGTGKFLRRIHDYSVCVTVYPIKYKSEVLAKLKE